MYYPDFHVHTFFSADSETKPEDHVARAIQMQMPAICFTDHMDFDYPPPYMPFTLDTPVYFAVMRDLQAECEGKIDMRIGAEIGMEPQLVETVTDYMQAWPWDFVIGSVHLANRRDPYYDAFFEGRTSKEAYRSYFESVLACLEVYDPVFDVLGHLDYVFRYGDRSVTDAFSEWPDLCDAILHLVVDKGLGLDVNTGGMKRGLPFAHPHDNLLKRFKELGGEIITLGSDAHDPSHLGDHFPETGERLKSLGFRYAAWYKERKPIFYPL